MKRYVTLVQNVSYMVGPYVILTLIPHSRYPASQVQLSILGLQFKMLIQAVNTKHIIFSNLTLII